MRPRTATHAVDTKTILVLGQKSFTLGQTLKALDYKVISLPNARDLFIWLRNQIKLQMPMPNAVLYDVDVPNDSPFACVEDLKSDPLFKEIPVILLGGNPSGEVKSRALYVGADDYYSLPVRIEDLIYRIKFLHEVNMVLDSSQPVEKVELEMESIKSRAKPAKRLFDIIAGTILLIVLSPLFVLIALLIKMDSRGPVIYISKRAGKEFEVFNFLKFRTMKLDADKELNALKDKNQYGTDNSHDPLFYKIEKDPRITGIGSFLRTTSLDELPQIINVLKGEMSLVGNRPLPLYEANMLTKDQWVMRFNAPAGMTGLWQVTKRGRKNMSVEERIKLDITYAEDNSFISDMIILAKTIPAALQKEAV